VVAKSSLILSEITLQVDPIVSKYGVYPKRLEMLMTVYNPRCSEAFKLIDHDVSRALMVMMMLAEGTRQRVDIRRLMRWGISLHGCRQLPVNGAIQLVSLSRPANHVLLIHSSPEFIAGLGDGAG